VQAELRSFGTAGGQPPQVNGQAPGHGDDRLAARAAVPGLH
jgi:hypothetical protein